MAVPKDLEQLLVETYDIKVLCDVVSNTIDEIHRIDGWQTGHEDAPVRYQNDWAARMELAKVALRASLDDLEKRISGFDMNALSFYG